MCRAPILMKYMKIGSEIQEESEIEREHHHFIQPLLSPATLIITRARFPGI